MAASTASMCLRRESLSVQAHISSKDSSRFNYLPSVDRFQVVASDGTFVCAQISISLYYLRTDFFETGGPERSLMPDTYLPSYETFMTPPGAFVCWTERVVSPAAKTTLRSPVPPSCFSMRHESSRPLRSNA